MFNYLNHSNEWKNLEIKDFENIKLYGIIGNRNKNVFRNKKMKVQCFIEDNVIIFPISEYTIISSKQYYILINRLLEFPLSYLCFVNSEGHYCAYKINQFNSINL